MISLLSENPLLFLFVVIAVGYPIGRIRIMGSSLGVAPVLFSGLAISAIDPKLSLPSIVYEFGLVVFVYSVGLNSGPRFFSSLNRRALEENSLVLIVIGIAAGGALLGSRLLNIGLPLGAGIFAGGLTNTPALAAAIGHLQTIGASSDVLNQPIVGYSIAYPMGVLGPIVALALMRRFWRIDYAAEAKALVDLAEGIEALSSRTVRITNPQASEFVIAEWVHRLKWNLIFVRCKRGSKVSLISGQTRLVPGDLVTVVGTENELDKVTHMLGEIASNPIDLDRSEFDFRRVFVSNSEVVGRTIGELNLTGRFGALVSRIRRGDSDLLPHKATVLELGDRVRVICRRDQLSKVSAFLGDSYRTTSEIDVFSFSLGLGLGLLIGLVPIPLLGGMHFKLGLAGGPLIVGLVLGRFHRSGAIVWSMPYSAGVMLRQIGLVLFLAGVGTKAGYAFWQTITQKSGLMIFFFGMAVTICSSFVALWAGYRIFKIPMNLLSGILSGMQTQPAVLGFALDQTKNEVPNTGYATVYPLATISKILFAQLLLFFA